MVSITVAQEAKRDLSRQWAWAEWFKPQPGFKFRDEEGNPCIVLGWDSMDLVYAVLEASPETTLAQERLLFHNWGIRTIDPETPLEVGAEPGWTAEQEERISGR